ncbi:hypothetical protein NE237_005148 [Protea cynaroides]|uniref:SWIM-type domain-containing protein n=1 Tax=Protea cynaroides TaxID=273540 RepID=A0A9Q0KKA5_9MAGN|nr:hypothetical protein NE237_005148 [Protea cynaroides]
MMLKEKDNDFQYEYVVDNDNRLKHIAWSHSASLYGYQHYGDVVFDMTYKLNIYKMPNQLMESFQYASILIEPGIWLVRRHETLVRGHTVIHTEGSELISCSCRNLSGIICGYALNLLLCTNRFKIQQHHLPHRWRRESFVALLPTRIGQEERREMIDALRLVTIELIKDVGKFCLFWHQQGCLVSRIKEFVEASILEDHFKVAIESINNTVIVLKGMECPTATKPVDDYELLAIVSSQDVVPRKDVIGG